jgi:hypothetical protein
MASCRSCNPEGVPWDGFQCSYAELQPVAFAPWHCWAAAGEVPQDVGPPAKMTHGQCSCQSQARYVAAIRMSKTLPSVATTEDRDVFKISAQGSSPRLLQTCTTGAVTSWLPYPSETKQPRLQCKHLSGPSQPAWVCAEEPSSTWLTAISGLRSTTLRVVLCVTCYFLPDFMHQAAIVPLGNDHRGKPLRWDPQCSSLSNVANTYCKRLCSLMIAG